MDPVTAAMTASTAVQTGETAASLTEGTLVASEIKEAFLGKTGLFEQVDTIRYSSLESVTARNEAFGKQTERQSIIGDQVGPTAEQIEELNAVLENQSEIEEGLSGESLEDRLLNAELTEEQKGHIQELLDAGDEEATREQELIYKGQNVADADMWPNEGREFNIIDKNREDGAAREADVKDKLENDYPAEDGYRIESQVPLRDKDGNIVKDPVSGESRRVDFVVIKDGKVIKSVEVTSETADKSAQIAKEDRIREAGGDYVLDRSTGELVPFKSGVKTNVVRRP